MSLNLAEGSPMTGDSFDAWVRPHLVAMQRYAARLTSPADADDVLQEALARAWRKWSTYDASRGEPLPWLLAIVRDRARRARRTAAVTLPVARAGGERDLDLERAIAALPPRQRLAVTLYYFVDLDVAAVAAAMGCAPGTVRATLHHARASLKGALDG